MNYLTESSQRYHDCFTYEDPGAEWSILKRYVLNGFQHPGGCQ